LWEVKQLSAAPDDDGDGSHVGATGYEFSRDDDGEEEIDNFEMRY
jgi:hypothetical protein